MDIVSAILSFIFNKEIHISSKAFAFIGIILLFLLIDNIFGFTHYYNTNSKLEVLKEIAAINKDTTLAPEVKSELLKIQKATLFRKSIKDRLYGISSPFSQNRSTVRKYKTTESIKTQGSYLIHYLTSNIAFYFFFIYMIISGTLENRASRKKKKERGDTYKEDPENWSTVALNLFAAIWVIGGITVITAWTLGLIPQILENYYYNYALQAILNIWLIIWIIRARNRNVRRIDERIKARKEAYQATTDAQSSS